MKTGLPNLLGAAIRDYFTDHLPRLRGTSPHTIHSYRDSMVLLLRFLARQRNKPITGLDLTDPRLIRPCDLLTRALLQLTVA
jgi:integrase/recombinase XerD